MGTDIHAVWQKRNNPAEAWQDIPSNWEQDRHYQLFAVLANVHNGYGFAGCPTGQSITPISNPRGLPKDFHTTDQEFYQVAIENIPPGDHEFFFKCGYVKENGKVNYSMGDHSHSWLSAAEMLEWFKFAPPIIKTGIISREVYNKWDNKSAPAEYCVIYGPDVVLTTVDNLASGNSPRNWTHIQVQWEEHLRLTLAYFFDEVQRLVDLHYPAEIRLVFGFDS